MIKVRVVNIVSNHFKPNIDVKQFWGAGSWTFLEGAGAGKNSLKRLPGLSRGNQSSSQKKIKGAGKPFLEGAGAGSW